MAGIEPNVVCDIQMAGQLSLQVPANISFSKYGNPIVKGALKAHYFYGYNIVAAGFITQTVCTGAMFTYGVFFKELEAAFGWSRAMPSGAS